MKIFKLFAAVVVFLVVVSGPIGCSSSSSSSISNPPKTTQAFQVPGTYTTYTDETSLFAVSYPGQWEPVSDLASITANVKDNINNLHAGLPVANASILYLAGLKTTTGYSPNATIVVEPAPSEVSNTDKAASAEIQGLKQLDPNYQEISRTKLVVNGKDAILIEYKAHFSSTGELSHNLFLVVLSGKNIWTLTCSATDEIFGQWAADFNNIARSFKITN
jgi:hypothetical protein